MAIYEFTSNSQPLVTWLKNDTLDYNPLEELLNLDRTLVCLEQKYGLSSALFYQRYQQGQMGDDLEIMGWAGRYRLYLELKRAITHSLLSVLTTNNNVTMAA